MAKVTQSEDTAKRFEAYGFDVVTLDGHDMHAVWEAFETAKATDNSKPKLIVAKTEIGRGIPEVAGTHKAHGEAGAKYADKARKGLGLPDEKFFVSDEVKAYFAQHRALLGEQYRRWEETYVAWREANREQAQVLDDGLAGKAPDDLLQDIPEFDPGYVDATRNDGGVVLQHLAKRMPLLFTGSADLFGSTKNYIQDGGDFGRGNYAARNIWFGIREHAMGAILNGAAYDGIFRPSGATFTVFADYLRPSIRLAALSRLPVLYVFTHDSVGVGEDGPTHQPVETCSGLRVIPGLDVIRPADPEEVAGAFVAALSRTDGPTMLLLTRQKIPTMHQLPANERREGVLRGGYICARETGELEVILIATGSELQHALAAAKEYGAGARVVSMPCCERFDRQGAEYRAAVLPDRCRRRVAIEAGVPGLWYKYVGLHGAVVGIDRFGLSAPGEQVMLELGMSAAAVLDAVRGLRG
jgi:transketolase